MAADVLTGVNPVKGVEVVLPPSVPIPEDAGVVRLAPVLGAGEGLTEEKREEVCDLGVPASPPPVVPNVIDPDDPDANKFVVRILFFRIFLQFRLTRRESE